MLDHCPLTSRTSGCSGIASLIGLSGADAGLMANIHHPPIKVNMGTRSVSSLSGNICECHIHTASHCFESSRSEVLRFRGRGHKTFAVGLAKTGGGHSGRNHIFQNRHWPHPEGPSLIDKLVPQDRLYFPKLYGGFTPSKRIPDCILWSYAGNSLHQPAGCQILKHKS